MTRRTKDAYFSVFKYIHENLIPLIGKGIIIDFEKAIRLALKELEIGIYILGCWFHFCQSLRRKMATLPELFNLIRSNENAKSLFRQFQCLALLPTEMIEKAFHILSKEALKLSTLFSPFIDYFDKEWIKIVKPIHFSVYMRGTRTTALAEAFNGSINKRFKTHSNLFNFCDSLLTEEVTICQQLENDMNGTIQKNNQSQFYKRRNKLIREYSLKLKDEDMDPMLFLKVMANQKNRILYADNEISCEQSAVEVASQTELYGALDSVVYETVDELSELTGINVELIETMNETPNSTVSQTNAISKETPDDGDIGVECLTSISTGNYILKEFVDLSVEQSSLFYFLI